MNEGTPKTLFEAVERTLKRYVSYKPEIPAESVKDAVIDYLSQHFTTSMIEHPECEKVLGELWKKIKK